MISPDSTEKRHGQLGKTTWGRIAAKEFAVYGTTCEAVEKFALSLQQALDFCKITYVDASHEESTALLNAIHKVTFAAANIFIENQLGPESAKRQLFLQTQLAIINGNHFEATSQIILYNPAKEASLLKRKHQLTDVKAIVLPKGVDKLPDHILNEINPDSKDIPILKEEQFDTLLHLIKEQYLNTTGLKALILTGGKSIRMGTDKSKLQYHREPQYKYIYTLLKNLSIEHIYVSCRADQKSYFEDQGLDVIEDRMNDIGPMGGILSAFMKEPDAAWLIVACDLPLLDEATLKELIESRDPYKKATAFINVESHFPEPLVAIWEPSIYQEALLWLSWGYSCPRKVLINSDCKLLHPHEPMKLANINTREEYESTLAQLKLLQNK